MKKSMRVLITERCNANCANCFNKSIRTGSDMPLDNFKKLCDYLSVKGGITKIKLMGGEPTIHPDFKEIYNYAQHCFPKVVLFTNAINRGICDVTPREDDIIVYNLECLPIDIDVEKFLIDKSGMRVLEIQIAHNSNIDIIKKKVVNITRKIKDKPVFASVTLNCMENIFEYKKNIVSKWKEVIDFLKKLRIKYMIDHNIPFCFLVNSGIEFYNKSMCSLDCSGLVTANNNLRYCNQYPIDLGLVCTKSNNEYCFLEFEELEKRLECALKEKIICNEYKLCRNCPYWKIKCNGGCFMHKSFIDVNSVIQSVKM